MSEERKEGVRAWWRDRHGAVWENSPTPAQREAYGPFTMEYRHRPPEGAPEPGERRMRDGIEHEARHVYVNHADRWNVATSSSLRRSGYVPLHEWITLPLAPPKPKYRLAAVELTEEQADAFQEFIALGDSVSSWSFPDLASLLRIEEIPE